jgi:hypothetical protein
MDKLQTLEEFLVLWYEQKLHPELKILIYSLVGMPTGYHKDTEAIINSITSKLPENREYSTMEVLYNLLNSRGAYWEYSIYNLFNISCLVDIKPS